MTPLLWAARSGHEGVARALIENGAAIEAKDSKVRQTPGQSGELHSPTSMVADNDFLPVLTRKDISATAAPCRGE